MISPYIQMAVERCKLPVRVVYDHWAGLWGVAISDWGSDHGSWWGDAVSAKAVYTEIVEKLSHETHS